MRSEMFYIVCLIGLHWAGLAGVMAQNRVSPGVQNTSNDTAGGNTTQASTSVSSTSTPASCDDDDDMGGVIAGAVIASLLAGMVIGAVAMFLVGRYLRRGSLSIPPKDYNVSQSSALDVNMNNGERTLSITTESDVVADLPAGPADPQVKGHKKLERLSKLGSKPTPAPKPLLGPDAKANVTTPLIYIGPRNNEDESPPSRNNEYNRQPLGPPRRHGDSSSVPDIVEEEEEEEEEGTEDPNYTNIGLNASNAQPYESLEVIPEEVEYANTQQYEEIGLVSASKT